MHALSRMNRFNGQTRAPISVLWHSMMVAELCRYEAPATRLEALLHDGAEAYLGDWISPLKGLTDGTLEKLRDRIQRTVFEAAGLHRNTNALSEPVQKADLLMARYEGNQEYGYGRRIPWHEPLRGVEIERVNAAMVLCGPPSEVPTEQQHVQWFFLKEAGKLLAQNRAERAVEPHGRRSRERLPEHRRRIEPAVAHHQAGPERQTRNQ